MAEQDFEIDVEALERKYAEERDKRLRKDAFEQYHELAGDYAAFDRDPNADPDFSRAPIVGDADVVTIGGGFAALLAAGRLREKGLSKIRIVEKGADFGGTWYWNRYPGAACDVESYVYMPMIEELGTMPSEKYAKAPEIFAHSQALGRHYDLYRDALFQTAITSARWDEKRLRWIVSTNRGDRIATRFLISCTGLLSNPKMPGIPGIDSFEGHSFHTSRWDYGDTGGDQNGNLTGLKDKVVGIIGTGSTGIQCIPHLGEWAKQLYVFQRTPSSIDPRGNGPTDPEWAKSLKPGWAKERMRNFTSLTSGGVEAVDLVHDGWTDIIRDVASPTGGTDVADEAALKYAQMKKMEQTRRRIAEAVDDPATAEALKPYYHYFCKRPCFHDEYLQTYNRSNVTLVDTKGKGVERVTPKGVVVDGKEYALDLLIFATGFDFIVEYSREAGVELFGEGGQKLSDHWADGRRTLHGMMTHGFPNFFVIGPAQSGVAVNYCHTAEEQASHIAYLIGECEARGIGAIQPTAAAEEEWIESILATAGARRGFLESCTPGYLNYEGRRGRQFALNDFYAAGPAAYMRMLDEWRNEGKLEGLEEVKAV
jgi:cyclohexanone monooxygenase